MICTASSRFIATGRCGYYIVLLACYLAGQFTLSGIADALNQLLIFPGVLWTNLTLQPLENSLVLGQMYTVALEMMFYMLAPFIVTRGLVFVTCAFLLTVALNGAFWYAHLDEWQYNFFPATLMYFLF